MPSIHQAIRYCHNESSLTNLKEKLRVAKKSKLTHIYPRLKRTILHEAACKNKPELLELVLYHLKKHGTDMPAFVNLHDWDGCTALHHAVLPVYHENKGETPQEASHKTARCVEILLQYDANPWATQPRKLAKALCNRLGYGLTPVCKLSRGMSHVLEGEPSDWAHVLEILVCSKLYPKGVSSHAILSGIDIHRNTQRRVFENIVRFGNKKTVRYLWNRVGPVLRHNIENAAVQYSRADVLALLIRDGAEFVLSPQWWSFIHSRPLYVQFPWANRVSRNSWIDRDVAVLGQINRSALRPWTHQTHIYFPQEFRTRTITLLLCTQRTVSGFTNYLLYKMYAYVTAAHFEPTFFLPNN